MTIKEILIQKSPEAYDALIEAAITTHTKPSVPEIHTIITIVLLSEILQELKNLNKARPEKSAVADKPKNLLEKTMSAMSSFIPPPKPSPSKIDREFLLSVFTKPIEGRAFLEKTLIERNCPLSVDELVNSGLLKKMGRHTYQVV